MVIKDVGGCSVWLKVGLDVVGWFPKIASRPTDRQFSGKRGDVSLPPGMSRLH